ncbi:MAG: NAD(P)/FAD-dependent oxidoreductase [Acidobacteriota bacterium]
MREHYDVVVIGAGPAGSVAAYTAATQGLDVLLLDKARFPRFKVCGCCLNARALRTLEGLGLGGLPAELGAHLLTHLRVHARARRASFALAGSVSVSRQGFDAALARRAERAGARFVDGTSATMGPPEGTSRRVDLRLPDGEAGRVQAGVVLIADGLAGTALRGHRELVGRVAGNSRMGAGTIVDHVPSGYEDATVTLACGRGGYVGMVRLEHGQFDVAAALDRDYVRSAGGPGRVVENLLDETGLPPIPDLGSCSWRGTPALTRQRPVIAGERFFVLGDAAGYVEPFTGEGIAWAIDGAAAVSEWVGIASRAWDASLARSWTRCHRALVLRRQWGCRAVAGVLRRPRLARALIGMCARTPGLARPLVRRLTQPSPAGSGGSER